MRISDWSSDVCSSDLFGRDRAQEDAFEKTTAVRTQDDAVAAQGFGTRDDSAGRVAVQRMEGEGDALLLQKSDGLMSIFGTFAVVVTVKFLLRSEVHTSELQSLMCNPYAAFRLNKTK